VEAETHIYEFFGKYPLVFQLGDLITFVVNMGSHSASFVPSAVRVNIVAVYSARREADLVMTSTGKVATSTDMLDSGITLIEAVPPEKQPIGGRGLPINSAAQRLVSLETTHR
jgi:hypothetical protein